MAPLDISCSLRVPISKGRTPHRPSREIRDIQIGFILLNCLNLHVINSIRLSRLFLVTKKVLTDLCCRMMSLAPEASILYWCKTPSHRLANSAAAISRSTSTITYLSSYPTDQHRRVIFLALMTQASGIQKNNELVGFVPIEWKYFTQSPGTQHPRRHFFFPYNNWLGGAV